ncbi:nucleoside triphosphate pyrophosphatase [Miniphocaeibacter halophilus]|uniref:Septum formation protein Maf n=1 Tax=Miniphocaeibacter halophilus TaxID=2931922 RepID=A0AC61MRJ1_9FIRM|nr:Maf family protein [Miniphocaeibacter halophilus]QQK08170.1 septum formation protein Maf [Miniphocaeibacter halophilus]
MNKIFNTIGVFNITNNLKFDKKYPVILGSSSPRRIELLKEITRDFKIIKPNVNEKEILLKSFNDNIKLDFLEDSFISCSEIALAKAKNIYKNNKNSLIISADTIVVTEDKIFGKPKSKEDAFLSLKSFLGKFHYIATSVCLFIDENNYDLFYSVSAVKFVEETKFSLNYIKKYVSSERPMDKAGSYGVQEVGTYLVDSVYGDYYNIVGFPVVEVRRRIYENFS